MSMFHAEPECLKNHCRPNPHVAELTLVCRDNRATAFEAKYRSTASKINHGYDSTRYTDDRSSCTQRGLCGAGHQQAKIQQHSYNVTGKIRRHHSLTRPSFRQMANARVYYVGLIRKLNDVDFYSLPVACYIDLHAA